MKRSLPIVLLAVSLSLSACDSNEELVGQCNLEYSAEDIVEGDGAEAVAGKRAYVDYEGFFCDESAPDHKGAKFDSSIDRGVPINFIVGAGGLIDGWEIGIRGMKVGGRRRLTVPPEMAYGEEGYQTPSSSQVDIPPNATLIFELELVDVQ